jgi:Fe-S cluster biogenesis protein NfuA
MSYNMRAIAFILSEAPLLGNPQPMIQSFWDKTRNCNRAFRSRKRQAQDPGGESGATLRRRPGSRNTARPRAAGGRMSGLKIHGGDVDILRVTEEGRVDLEFKDACRGCALQSVTFAVGIRQRLHEIPGVSHVTMKGVRVSSIALERVSEYYRGYGSQAVQVAGRLSMPDLVADPTPAYAAKVRRIAVGCQANDDIPVPAATRYLIGDCRSPLQGIRIQQRIRRNRNTDFWTCPFVKDCASAFCPARETRRLCPPLRRFGTSSNFLGKERLSARSQTFR